MPRVCNVFMLAPAFYNRTICHWLGLGLGLGGGNADLPVLRVLQAGVRGLKVLPHQGAWVTEATTRTALSQNTVETLIGSQVHNKIKLN